jgi:hypothetical protein
MVTFSVNGGNGGNALSVRSLINTKTLSKTRRALLGASVLKGEIDLKPTAKDVARMVGCSVNYLHTAVKLSPEEEQRVRANLRPLVESRVKVLPTSASPRARLAEVVAELGIAGTINALIAIEPSAAVVWRRPDPVPDSNPVPDPVPVESSDPPPADDDEPADWWKELMSKLA